LAFKKTQLEGTKQRIVERSIEKSLRESYEKSTRELRQRFIGGAPCHRTLGMEAEYSVVISGTAQLVDQVHRDSIISRSQGLLKDELGASQIELNTPPFYLDHDGFSDLEKCFNEFEIAATSIAAECGAELVRLGSFPTCPIDEVKRTRTDRNDQYQEWIDLNRRLSTSTVIGNLRRRKPVNASVLGLFNSIQFNVAMNSLSEAIELLNLSYAIAPPIIALTGNARFLDMVDTGYSDIRMLTWELTHDIRTAHEVRSNQGFNVGMPPRYFTNIQDYLTYVRTALLAAGNLPFIKNNVSRAFEIGMGLCWLDSKLKFKNDQILLEFRPISIQPSVAEDIAVGAYFIGLLEYHRRQMSSLPTMSQNAWNRRAAMEKGLTADFIMNDGKKPVSLPAKFVVAESLKNAAVGLTDCGLGNNVEKLDPLFRRLEQNMNPSDELASHINQLGVSSSRRLALEQAVRFRVVRSRISTSIGSATLRT